MNERKPYSSDLTDDQWQLLEPLVPAPKEGGRPPKYERREIVNAVLYLTRNGCAWRNLPHDLPPWSLVHYYFWHWKQDGTWQNVHDRLREQVRRSVGRDPQPSGRRPGQPVHQDDGKRGVRGYDGGKKINGRKRNVLVDTDGLLLGCLVTAADVGDRAATKDLLRRLWLGLPRLQKIWADGNYDGPLVQWVKNCWGYDLEIVVKPEGQKGFSVLGAAVGGGAHVRVAWQAAASLEGLRGEAGYERGVHPGRHDRPDAQEVSARLNFLYTL